MKALNVAVARKLGWIHKAADIASEFPPEMAQGAERYFDAFKGIPLDTGTRLMLPTPEPDPQPEPAPAAPAEPAPDPEPVEPVAPVDPEPVDPEPAEPEDQSDSVPHQDDLFAGLKVS